MSGRGMPSGAARLRVNGAITMRLVRTQDPTFTGWNRSLCSLPTATALDMITAPCVRNVGPLSKSGRANSKLRPLMDGQVRRAGLDPECLETSKSCGHVARFSANHLDLNQP